MQQPVPDDGIIRKLWINETDAYRDHLLRLDRVSRNRRFSGAVSDELIARHASSANGPGVVVHGFFVDGVLRGAAELRPPRSPLTREGEAAFSIEQPWQSHGVGSSLMGHMLLAARNRGIRTLHMICLADNQRMQQLAKKFDAELTFEYGSVIGEVETPYPTPVSVMREVVADSAHFATAMLDVQKRLLKLSPAR